MQFRAYGVYLCWAALLMASTCLNRSVCLYAFQIKLIKQLTECRETQYAIEGRTDAIFQHGGITVWRRQES
jgi:hypothetical protein